MAKALVIRVATSLASLALGLTVAACGDDGASSGGTGGESSASTSSGPAGPGPAGPGSGPGSGSGSGNTTSSAGDGGAGPTSGPGGPGPTAGSGGDPSGAGGYIPPPDDGPPAGNPDGNSAVPGDAQAVDTSSPTNVVGDGTPESCTSTAFVGAVANGGIITFDCGPDPVTIVLDETAKVFNDTTPDIVIDGGGKVILSGAGQHRILYQNTCDPDQVWTTDHCNNQDTPRLTIQNLTFIDGSAKGNLVEDEPEGGGAIFVRGGRLKVVNSRFFRNVCDDVGPDIGGGAIRTFDQFDGLPVYVVHSTFGGGADYANVCSNGSGLSSIGVSYTVINSLFSYNDAIGYGANPTTPPDPGGGSGGAIYNDGNTFTLTLDGVLMENNHANEGGGAIFFVSNDLSGTLVIRNSVLRNNPSDGFETQGYPGIFVLANGDPVVENSTIE